MSFKLVVETEDGPEVVHEVEDRRVTKVMFGSRSGGAGEIRIDPDQTEVWIAFETANPDATYLSDVEAIQNPTNLTEDDVKERNKKKEEAGVPVTNEGQDNFTPEAIEERKKAEEEAKKAEEARAKETGDASPPKAQEKKEPATSGSKSS